MQLAEFLYYLPIIYIIVINILAFSAMWWDKRKASQHEWRIAEATLHILGILGGAVGIIGGMFRFRHKTQKKSFQAITIVGLIISFIIYWIAIMQYI
ncbi:MAG: DUF1294 domain-containing protein [Candidatus Thorarchaeota archaeon]